MRRCLLAFGTLRAALAVSCAALPFVATPTAAQTAEWSLLDASPFHDYRFEDGDFLDPQRGWIVNGSGETWRTLDGGASWALRSTSDGYLRSAAFVSETLGWVGVLFSSRRLYETRDGGATMVNVTSRISPAVPGGICGLFALDAQTVYGVGQFDGPAYVIKTTDGGASWQSRSLAALAGSLIDVYFFDALHGLAVGGTLGTDVGSRAIILATEDGGATWTERFRSTTSGSGRAEWGWKITFPSPQVGYVSVEHNGYTTAAKVLKTTDGGLTWTQLTAPGGGATQGIGFLTPQRGWISGRGTTLTTADGGATWTDSPVLDGSVNRFAFFGDTLGYAMGHRIYRLDAVSETPAEPAPTAGRPGLRWVGPNPTEGVVVVAYRLSRPGPVAVAVFDALGRRVAQPAQGTRPAGENEIVWDGRGTDGARVPPGVYLVRFEAEGRRESRAVTVVR